MAAQAASPNIENNNTMAMVRISYQINSENNIPVMVCSKKFLRKNILPAKLFR